MPELLQVQIDWILKIINETDCTIAIRTSIQIRYHTRALSAERKERKMGNASRPFGCAERREEKSRE